jgi:hypothetical protein
MINSTAVSDQTKPSAAPARELSAEELRFAAKINANSRRHGSSTTLRNLSVKERASSLELGLGVGGAAIIFLSRV